MLSLPLPLVERDEVQLHRSVLDELIVRIGNWKRNIALPSGLARLEIDDARYEGYFLNVYFALAPNQTVSSEELKPTRWQALRNRLRAN